MEEILTDLDFSGLTYSSGSKNNGLAPNIVVLTTLLIIGGMIWYFNSLPEVTPDEQLSEQTGTTNK
jgi:hypothetical protein